MPGAERFFKEIHVTASLQHPHILPLHDSGEVAGFLFYVMPYIEGETLRDRIDREKQLGVKDSVAITQAASSPTESIGRSWRAGPCTVATEVDWMGTDP